MANYLCQHIFQLDLQQFTESWYLVTSTFDLAMARLEAVAQPRANLTRRPCKLIGLRVSDADVAGDSRVKTGLWQASSAATFADFPWTGELIRCTAGPSKRRQIILRGVPDVETVLPSNQPLSSKPDWNLNFGIWRAAMLVAPRFSLRSMSTTIDAPTAIITGVAIDAPSGRVQITAAGHGISTNELIEVNQVKSTPSINGRWRAIRVNADTIQLARSNIGRITWDGNGVLRTVTYSYSDITDYVDLRKSRRLPGMSRFGVIKGRRPRITEVKGGL